jgi:hypothetical protein
MRGNGFAPNLYDPCVYNKNGSSGTQVTVVMYVEDLCITDLNEIEHEEFKNNMSKSYREVKVNKGKIFNHNGMTFDFVLPGKSLLLWRALSALFNRNTGCGN